MVYKKKAVKKTYAKKSGWVGKASGALAIAQKALSMANFMKGMINCEKKHLEGATNATFYNAGVTTCISDIGQGDNTNQRNGDSVLCRSIYVKMQFTKYAAAVSQGIRYLIWQDTGFAVGASAPTLADVLQYVASAYSCVSPLLRETQGRFKILRDKTFVLSDAKETEKIISEYIKVYTHIKWDNTGTAYADRSKNHIYVSFISNDAVGEPSAYTMTNRIGYYDN